MGVLKNPESDGFGPAKSQETPKNGPYGFVFSMFFFVFKLPISIDNDHVQL